MCKVYVEELGKEFDFEVMSLKYGHTNFEENKIAYIEDAYITNIAIGFDTDVIYEANAIDNTGKLYKVIWETTEEFNKSSELHALIEELKVLNGYKSFDDGIEIEIAELESKIELMEKEGWSSDICEDESNACDWDNPSSIVKIG